LNCLRVLLMFVICLLYNNSISSTYL
jgi:hypothetical protein